MITLGALVEGLDAVLHGCGTQLPLVDATTDSRHAGPGIAFIALRGANHDGHAFVDAAARAGSPVVIVEAGSPAPGAPHVAVESTARALPILAANLHGWPGRALRLAAVTGTNGKTTTTHLVGSILDAARRPFARLGTTGNWMVDREEAAAFTTPFPLELQARLADALRRGATDVIMEASSHALAQDRVAPLRYRTVALTSFSQDHLDFHANMQEYLQAKLRLARDFLDEAGTAVAPVDGAAAGPSFLHAVGPGRVCLGVAKHDAANAEIAATHWRIGPQGIVARVRTPAGPLELTSPLVGAYNLDNLLVATGLALGLGVELEAIGRGLAHARGAPGRLEKVHVDGVHGPAVFVDYAHTPDAVARAIEALRATCVGRLIVVLGCGGDRDKSKRPLMGAVAAEHADLLFATSDNPRTEDPATIVDQMLAGVSTERRYVREIDRARAIARSILEANAEDTVLIAGKGHEDYQVLGTVKTHFDDREHARLALSQRSGPDA